MTAEYFERLSGLDASFLVMESAEAHMHVSAILVFDGTALQTEEGGIDFDAIRRLIASRLHLVPRYRQRLAYTPIEGHPVWIDDESFNLDYHIRHTSLPRPGSDEQLKLLAGRISSQRLDRSRPLWEMWVVEGLSDQRMAIISKVHHCMIDGMSGVDLMETLLDTSPQKPPDRVTSKWTPRPAPRTMALLASAARHWAQLPFEIASSGRRLLDMAGTAASRFLSSDSESDSVTVPPDRALRSTRALWETLEMTIKPSSNTPINRAIGPYRRSDWRSFPLSDVKKIKNKLDATVNDVVLATVSGAMRRYLKRRRTDVESIDFRIMAPVSMRGSNQSGTLGNNVSAWLLRLPLHEPDPVKRLEAINERTLHLKKTNQAMGAAKLTEASNWTSSTLLSIAVQIAARIQPFNLVVTNVPGPQKPLYLGEAKLLASYPQVPLFYNLGLGIALFSYTGTLHWGFTGDWDLVPDLADFCDDVSASFEDLREAALGRVSAKN